MCISKQSSELEYGEPLNLFGHGIYADAPRSSIFITTSRTVALLLCLIDWSNAQLLSFLALIIPSSFINAYQHAYRLQSPPKAHFATYMKFIFNKPNAAASPATPEQHVLEEPMPSIFMDLPVEIQRHIITQVCTSVTRSYNT